MLTWLRVFCDAAASERKTAKGTLRAAVEKEAERLLSHGKANVETVAKALALSVRTFQRRLGEHGVVFKTLVDQLRRELALQYLADGKADLTEIAFLVGYSELSAFDRAFRRWTGSTPVAARKELRAGGHPADARS